eukprot:m.12811 g.12811  ORF g.12811 m.12811 type:complete len:609 (-) comp8209_c0_seq1:66-1892(-)
MPAAQLEPSSYTLTGCETTHLDLTLTVDFETKTLDGDAVLTLKIVDEGISHVVLDTRDLTIKKIVDYANNSELEFQLGESTAEFGASLTIKLPSEYSKDQECVIKISYTTSPEAKAVQWLAPEQTAGKKHPYLFTQCEAIHARSMVPVQDTPAFKFTYSAKITCKNPLRALMSAQPLDSTPAENDQTTYTFKQKTPIPSYLLALVVGALESRDIGPRSKVWSEKEVVDKAAYEFAETEQFLATAEKLFGPYVWGNYDLVVLPPSFPFGGMENPQLTFVTPTLLAGDRSLVNVVAHEIVHSWFGNLVTNRTWEHFWLNEGFTVFGERKLVGRIHGEAYRQADFIGGHKTLQDTIDVFAKTDRLALTALLPPLEGVDPDDAFSSVPYEKGSMLLFYLEQLVGGPKEFEPFLKAYVSRYQYKTLTTDDMKAFLYEYFPGHKDKFDAVDWQNWLHTPGMPAVIPEYDTSLTDTVTKLVAAWKQGTPEPSVRNALSDFSANQVSLFLDKLLLEDPLTHDQINALETAYSFSKTGNSETRFRWQKLCLRASYEPIVDDVIQFITEQGRMKFVLPLYRALCENPAFKKRAVQTFYAHEQLYHPICRENVKKIVSK